MSQVLEQPIVVSFFADKTAKRVTERRISPRDLAERIRTSTARIKDNLPWLKLARFGDRRSDRDSLRNDDNVLAVSGIEADYDGGVITFDRAVELLEQNGIAALVYTSPSHTDLAPRWRVLCPLSEDMPPERRAHMLGRLNGLFAGALASESFTLSQAYYFGSVNRNPAHRVQLVDGSPIDEHDDLDGIWRGRPGTKVPANGTGNGHDQSRQGPLDEAAMLAEIISGKKFHTAAIRLLGRWAFKGVPMLEARQRLVDAFEQVFPPDRDDRWRRRFADIERCVADVYAKEAGKRDNGERQSRPGDARQQKPDEGANHDQARPDGVDKPADADPQSDIGFAPSRFVFRDAALIPRRNFLLGTRLIIGKVTGGVGPGGSGKTTFALTTATSIATGLALTGSPVHKTGNVLIICNEEDRVELERRIHAICSHFKLDPHLLEPSLHILTGFEHMTKAVICQNGTMLRSPDIPALIAYCRQHQIIYCMIDPFVTTHDGEENDNKLIDLAVREFAQVAHVAQCAIDLLHHIVKSSDPEAHAGDISKARGAGAFGAAIRGGYTIAEMGEKSGSELNIPKTDWPRFCRVDDGKHNYSLKSKEPSWFYRETVWLPNGEAVGVVRPFDMSLKKAELARTREATKEPAREDIALIAARAMTADRMALKFMLPVVAHARDVKDSRARQIIEEAIPEAPGAREVTLDGKKFRLWRTRDDPAHSRGPVMLVRQEIDADTQPMQPRPATAPSATGPVLKQKPRQDSQCPACSGHRFWTELVEQKPSENWHCAACHPPRLPLEQVFFILTK